MSHGDVTLLICFCFNQFAARPDFTFAPANREVGFAAAKSTLRVVHEHLQLQAARNESGLLLFGSEGGGELFRSSTVPPPPPPPAKHPLVSQLQKNENRYKAKLVCCCKSVTEAAKGGYTLQRSKVAAAALQLWDRPLVIHTNRRLSCGAYTPDGETIVWRGACCPF